MRKHVVWLGFFLLVAMMLISPQGVAGKSVFGVSEELMKAIEQEKAFERYLAENNFQLANQFPFLQSNLLPVPLVHGPLDSTNDWHTVMLDGFFSGGGSYSKSTENIVKQFSLLPAEYMNLILYDESQKYTIEARSQVSGFTISYGYDASKPHPEVEEGIVKNENHFTAQNAGLEFQLLPGMSINADYKKTMGSETDEAKKSVRVAYDPVHFASISAGYGVISTNTNPFDFSALMAEKADEQEDIIVKQLGLSLRPTTNSLISANYTFVNEKGEPIQSTKARFAFRLGDRSTGLNATYEMENGKNHGISTSAGLELGLLDLATLKAVYSTNVGDQTTRESSQSSTVDLGFNLNLAGYSSFHLQYKLILPDELLEASEEEQVAEAKLVLRF